MSEYRSLVESFPPRPIRDEEQLSQTWSRIEELLTKPRRSSAEDDYLSLLSDMVEHWEADHVQMPKLHGVELVRELLDDNQLPQRALVEIFATDSIVSEVLSGKRELQRKHIEGLASFFNVSPAAFFPAAQKPTVVAKTGRGRARVPKRK
jgi:HTH-type transcriptional regulator/antitoxin HigA